MCPQQSHLTDDWRLSEREKQAAPTGGTWLPRTSEDAEYSAKGGDHPSALADRWRRALNLDAHIQPVAPGMYHLTSESGETYVVDVDGYVAGECRAVCECQDYRYRGAEKGYDCKHILVVKRYVRHGLLPPADRNPVDWLHDRLDDLEVVAEATLDGSQFNGILDRIDEMRDRPYVYEYCTLLEQLHEVRADSHPWRKPTDAFTPGN